MKRFVPLAAGFLMAACGGGENETGVAASPPTPVAAPGEPAPTPAPVSVEPAPTPSPASPVPAPTPPPISGVPTPEPPPVLAEPVPGPIPEPVAADPDPPLPSGEAPAPVSGQPVELLCTERGVSQPLRFTVLGPERPWSSLTVEAVRPAFYGLDPDHLVEDGPSFSDRFAADPDGAVLASGQFEIIHDDEGWTVGLDLREAPQSNGDIVYRWASTYRFVNDRLVGAQASWGYRGWPSDVSCSQAWPLPSE